MKRAYPSTTQNGSGPAASSPMRGSWQLPVAPRSNLRGKAVHSIYKAADAILTTPLRPAEPVGTELRTLLRPRSANYERVAALAGAIERLWPGMAQRFSRSLLRTEKLPLASATSDSIRLLGYGSGSTVFLLPHAAAAPLVLKVYRRSLGHSPDMLQRIAHFFTAKYRTVQHWYGGPLNLVPPASYFLLNSPLLSTPAVGMLQPYIGGQKRDLFEDYTAEELLDLLRTDAGLCRQFRFFARRTMEFYRTENCCVDFLGRENVMLNKQDGGWRLLVLDYGIFNVDEVRQRSPATGELVSSRLTYLETVYEKSLRFARTIEPQLVQPTAPVPETIGLSQLSGTEVGSNL